MVKHLLLLAGFIAATIASADGQGNTTPSPDGANRRLAFDVTSVRQNKSYDDPNSIIPLGPRNVGEPTGGSFWATAYPLIDYIAFAYKMDSKKLTAMQRNLPGWITTDKFDIRAKTEKHDVTKDQLRLMMRALLEDRFRLGIHTETTQIPVYALVLATAGQTGPRLQPHSTDSPCSKATPQNVWGSCGGNVVIPSLKARGQRTGGRNVPFDYLVERMGTWGKLGLPVLDQTGLTGNFDYAIEWTPAEYIEDLGAATYIGPPAPVASFLEALQEQFGLKLILTTAPSVSIFVDRVQRPSEN
jgi:uncharacterized protein (TIGR03435 family)